MLRVEIPRHGGRYFSKQSGCSAAGKGCAGRLIELLLVQKDSLEGALSHTCYKLENGRVFDDLKIDFENITCYSVIFVICVSVCTPPL